MTRSTIPCIARVQASLGRRGLLSVGDCKMASRETRACIASAGDCYLCPLPQVQLAPGELEAELAAVGRGEQALVPVLRAHPDGEPALIAEGCERQVPMSLEVDGQGRRWLERRLVGRSLRQAQAAEAALRARVATAQAQGEAFNQRGRGRKRFADIRAIRQAAHEIVQRYGVEDFLWLRFHQESTTHTVRAYRSRAARVEEERHAKVEVRVDEPALETAVRRLGWRVYGTHQPREQLSLAQAVLAYRNEYQVESSLGRLQGRPLSLRPRYVQRDAHATGLIRLLSLGLRV